MTAKGWPDDHPASERFEQCRVIAARERRKVAGGVDQLVAEAGSALSRLSDPQPRAAGLCGARRETFGGLDMGYHEPGERYGAVIENLRQPAETGVKTIDKTLQAGVFIAECCSEPANARGRARPENRPLEPARQAPKHARVKSAGSERVLECGEQRHRGEPALGEIQYETQKRAGRCAVQWQAGGIIDLNPPAAQFDGNPASKLTVGSDECR